MILGLRLFFTLVVASMLGVTFWASGQCPLFGVPREVATHPWFIATLFDAYWGFLTFYLWVLWRERSWWARGTWLIAILLLGNLAMASYALEATFRASPQAKVPDWVMQRRDSCSPLGPALALVGIAVIALALQ